MQKIIMPFILTILSFSVNVYADSSCNRDNFSYCDSSAGRYVMHTGDYSKCYCTKTAVMDLTVFNGCCLWQGGVLKTTDNGIVICNNGAIAKLCSLQAPQDIRFSWY